MFNTFMVSSLIQLLAPFQVHLTGVLHAVLTEQICLLLKGILSKASLKEKMFRSIRCLALERTYKLTLS